jgi:HK97 family phage prohead protease
MTEFKSAGARAQRKAVAFEFKFLDDKAAPGTFEGYGSVFNNEDDGGDLIQPGAFAGVIQRHQAKGTMPKLLLNHGSMSSFFGADPMADLPVGCWDTMSEDTHGLQCKGRLINLDTESGKRIYGAMKEKALDGLSIGYSVGDYVRGTKPNEPRRTIKTIKSLPEVSLVTFPMNDMARTNGVKASDIRTAREFEEFLREIGGFSNYAAKSIAQNGFRQLENADGPAEGVLALKESLERLNLEI